MDKIIIQIAEKILGNIYGCDVEIKVTKHYNMNCESGIFGVEKSEIGSSKK